MPTKAPTARKVSALPIHRRPDREIADARGYDWRWRKARHVRLQAHPLCVCCLANGHVEPATVLDHIKPHDGDQTLFWDADNWQSLCARCHSYIKQVIEGQWRGGRLPDTLLRLDRPLPIYHGKYVGDVLESCGNRQKPMVPNSHHRA